MNINSYITSDVLLLVRSHLFRVEQGWYLSSASARDVCCIATHTKWPINGCIMDIQKSSTIYISFIYFIFGVTTSSFSHHHERKQTCCHFAQCPNQPHQFVPPCCTAGLRPAVYQSNYTLRATRPPARLTVLVCLAPGNSFHLYEMNAVEDRASPTHLSSPRNSAPTVLCVDVPVFPTQQRFL